ncbi:hypothetical protein TR2A62_1228 [Thalassobium sp. R2A62]|nr:hypothetical protein TR2A62_1228 [Thalassobium sp. R2A62]MDG2453582.1 hypothetical protein [Paracoccaceae bacterium]
MTISKRVFNGRCAIAAVTVAAIGGAVGLSSAVFLTREGFGHRGIFLGSMRLCLASLPCFWLV